MQHNTELATVSVPKLLLKLSVPAILAQLINALYNIVDRMYIARMPEVGTTALTGLGVTFPILMIISAFAALAGMGGAPLASISMGQNNKSKAEKILGNSFSILVVISLVLTVFFLLTKTYFLKIFGASAQTLPYADDYLTIYLLGTASVQFSLGLNPFITAQGFSKTSMFTVLIGAISNIILDPIFIFGFDMGVKGAAWATIISQTISAVWVLWFLVKGKADIKLKASSFKIDGKISMSVLALGFSPFIMRATESVVQIGFNVTLAKYGTDLHIAAMVILNSVMQMTTMPAFGITQGAQPIISYNYGAQNYDRVKSAIKHTAIWCTVFTGIMWALCLFTPDLLLIPFTSDAELTALCIPTMRMFFAGMILFGFQVAYQNSFLALGQAKVSIFLALLRKIILLVPLTVLLPRILNLGTTGVFLAEPISDTIAAITTIIMFTSITKELLSKKID